MTKNQLTAIGITGGTDIPEKLCMIIFDNDRKIYVDDDMREQQGKSTVLEFDMDNELVKYTTNEGQKRIPTISYTPFDCIQCILMRK